MSIIIPANSAVGGGFDVDNSVRYNGSNDSMNRTFAAGNQKTWTWSMWIKRSKLSVDQTLFGRMTSTGDAGWFNMSLNSDDTITFGIYNTSYRKTNRVFRDISAWYNIVLAFDTTQGTAANRIKFYINGVEETSFSISNDPSQNFDGPFNANAVHSLGIQPIPGGYEKYYGGYISEVTFIDGAANAVTDFGEFDEDSGIWKPIDVSGLTFGNNGFYLDFEDSSALGNDAAGSNNWTTNNLTAIDQTTDSPTNNFATLNSIDNYYAGGTFSEGNLQVISVNTGYTYNTSTFGGATGKWYWEVKWSAQPTGSTNQVQIGIAKRVAASATTWLGSQAYTYGYQGSSGHVQVSDGNASGSVATTYAIGDIISVAMDLDNNKIHFAKNGTYTNSSDPAANSGGVTITAPDSTSGDSGFYFAAFGDGNNSLQETGQFNFGAGPPYAISSGNADGNGYGNFEYAPPSGFLSLCTANLSEVNS